MASVAIGVVQLVITICVTGNAGNCEMPSGQFKCRAIVIECRGRPCSRCMARLACMTERIRYMVRIRRLRVFRLMARIAIGVMQLVITIGVA